MTLNHVFQVRILVDPQIYLIMLKFNIRVLQPDEECPLKYGNCAGCPYFGTVVDEGIVCYADEEPSQED